MSLVNAVLKENPVRLGEDVRFIAVLVAAALTVPTMVWAQEEPATPATPADPPAALVVFSENASSGEYVGDTDVGAQLVSLAGERLWKEGQSAVAVSDGKVLERSAVAVADGSGGYIVAFEVEFRTGKQSGDVDIYAQRLSSDGLLLWGEGKGAVPVAASVWRERNPVIVSDGAGGAIIVFEQHAPPEGEQAGDIDVGAQRVSPQGALLWNQGERSAIVSSGKLPERAPTAVADGQGGVIVVFEVEITSGKFEGDVDLYAQHLDASGSMLWNEGKVSSEVASGQWRERRPLAVTDGSGGVIVVFEEHGPPGGEYEGDIDVGAHRISGEGKRLWGEERSVAVAEAKGYLERRPTALSDGVGGVWVVFEGEARSGEQVGDSEILAQRVSPTGGLVWPEKPKVVAASGWSERAPAVVGDGAEGIIVAFEEHAPQVGEYAGDIDIGAQRLSPAGEMLWNDGKRSATVSSGQWLERGPTVIPDGAGGAIILFEAEAREGELAGDTDVYAQRIDASGAMVWNEGKRSTMVAGSKWRETELRAVAAR